MTWLLILGFTISSSLDNLGVGLSYGIREIRIGFLSNLLIAAVCFLFSYSGIWFGKWISAVLPGVLPVLLSAFVLLIIGLRIILLSVPRKVEETAEQPGLPEQQVQQGQEGGPAAVSAVVPASRVGGLSAILRNPESVDLDKSKHIGIFESLILGVALSANAMTNGLSAGLLGISPLIISLMAAGGSFLTVWLGVWVGCKVAGVRIGPFTLGQFGTMVSGIILLLIAVNSFF
ncbi:sporulation membrane protein YtaF [Paenibacillus radicis (ex Gao et al. 2016)]|uniref:Sporulation membrane protein YtaF n=1 Tax=Paenibacillus radicis (ex Gao et al. 2016) TaxID=1737354 RepID=A0A917GXY2_9BACL|nr:sporulation membrane protein YtaF [Paenibacillus radicis (ex Gao et al. 2016)]GGG59879.1 sporulation membrane protein YtaF [Paenibacillus radicis (ex Gao et al. 2016)]